MIDIYPGDVIVTKAATEIERHGLVHSVRAAPQGQGIDLIVEVALTAEPGTVWTLYMWQLKSVEHSMRWYVRSHDGYVPISVKYTSGLRMETLRAELGLGEDVDSWIEALLK